MHHLRFNAYCGMSWQIASGTLIDCRNAAAKILRKRKKNGHPIVKLKENKWEVQEPENSILVPDTAGVLVLETPEIEEEEESYEDDY